MQGWNRICELNDGWVFGSCWQPDKVIYGIYKIGDSTATVSFGIGPFPMCCGANIASNFYLSGRWSESLAKAVSSALEDGKVFTGAIFAIIVLDSGRNGTYSHDLYKYLASVDKLGTTVTWINPGHDSKLQLIAISLPQKGRGY